MGRTVTFTPKVRRQRKMTILLTPQQSPKRHVSLVQPTQPPAPADMGLSSLVEICRSNWSQWCKQVHDERLRCLGETSQYPTGTNIAALMDTETLQHRMDQVSLFSTSTDSSPNSTKSTGPHRNSFLLILQF